MSWVMGKPLQFRIDKIETPEDVPTFSMEPFDCRVCWKEMNKRYFFTITGPRQYAYVCSEECANVYILMES